MTRHFDRRHFLVATSCVVGAVATREFWRGWAERSRRFAGIPRRAVFREMSYFSFDGTGETYEHPAGNRATRSYVDRIGEEEFLRRHWFA